jgi:hypothetical protein
MRSVHLSLMTRRVRGLDGADERFVLSKCDFRIAFDRPNTLVWPPAHRPAPAVLLLTRENRRFVPETPHSSPKCSSRAGQTGRRTAAPIRRLRRSIFANADTSATESGQFSRDDVAEDRHRGAHQGGRIHRSRQGRFGVELALPKCGAAVRDYLRRCETRRQGNSNAVVEHQVRRSRDHKCS